jgi:hypothetical protein
MSQADALVVDAADELDPGQAAGLESGPFRPLADHDQAPADDGLHPGPGVEHPVDALVGDEAGQYHEGRLGGLGHGQLGEGPIDPVVDEMDAVRRDAEPLEVGAGGRGDGGEVGAPVDLREHLALGKYWPHCSPWTWWKKQSDGPGHHSGEK